MRSKDRRRIVRERGGRQQNGEPDDRIKTQPKVKKKRRESQGNTAHAAARGYTVKCVHALVSAKWMVACSTHEVPRRTGFSCASLVPHGARRLRL